MQLPQCIPTRLAQFIPQSPYALAFLTTTILESAIDIVLESILIDRLNLIHPSDPSSALTPLAVYLGIFILAHLFQLYVATDALRHKNTIQLIGLCSFNFCFLVFAVLQVPEIRELTLHAQDGQRDHLATSTDSVILTIIPICIGISQIAFMFLTWHLFKEFGWQIYRKIGADRKIKRFFLVYQIFMCLLKFDYFFLIGFSVQLVLLVPTVGTVEKRLTIIALPITLFFLISGYYGVRRENKPLVSAFVVGLLSGASYFIYKLLRIWKGRQHDYKDVFKSLTLFSISCLFMTLVTFTTAILCLKNFGRGLKVHVNKQGVNKKKAGGGIRIAVGRKWVGTTNLEQRADGVDVGGQPRKTYMDSSTRLGAGGGTKLSIPKHDERLQIGSDHSECQTLETFKTNEHDSFDDPLRTYEFSPHLGNKDPPPRFIIQDENLDYLNSTTNNNSINTNNHHHQNLSQPNHIASDYDDQNHQRFNSNLRPHHQSFADSHKRMSID